MKRVASDSSSLSARETLAALDVLVFALSDNGGLELAGEVPSWWPRLRSERPCGSEVEDQFPFIENFLVDAHEFWTSHVDGQLASGPWVEAALDGDPMHLEIHAHRRGDLRLLVVERLGREFKEQHRVLQRARETSLDREQLARAEERLTEALRELEQSHRDLNSIFDRLRLGTAVTDAEGCVSFLSRTAAEWLECEPTDRIGRPWVDLFEGLDVRTEGLERSFELPEAERQRVELRVKASSETHWFEVDLRDDPRDPNRRMLFFYDVSDLHRLRAVLGDQASYGEMIGRSPVMVQVYELIRELGPYDTTVLVEGETGTGKELVAQAIHGAGPRGEGPFIAVNCAGLTESLLTSQLFGHRKGSFTGAIEDRVGVFEAANGGTLFLDEIGDIPMAVQTALLRVLQEREVTPVGDTTPRKVDVRVVAATNKNLQEEVDAGRFRADLFYRIRVARVELPPLADRREDVPLLGQRFLQDLALAFGKEVRSISDEALALLLDYEWPGNVRELRSAIEFGVIRAKGEALQPADLPPEVIQLGRGGGSGEDDREQERRRLLSALRQAKGNRSRAARLLGISRATFYRRLEQLDLRDLDAEVEG